MSVWTGDDDHCVSVSRPGHRGSDPASVHLGSSQGTVSAWTPPLSQWSVSSSGGSGPYAPSPTAAARASNTTWVVFSESVPPVS